MKKVCYVVEFYEGNKLVHNGIMTKEEVQNIIARNSGILIDVKWGEEISIDEANNLTPLERGLPLESI